MKEKLIWQNRGDYDFTTYNDEYGTTHDIYLYHKQQTRKLKNKNIVYNRLEIEQMIGFDNDIYTYAFYYLDDKLMGSE